MKKNYEPLACCTSNLNSSLLDEGSGTEFDHDLAQSFIRMMRQWEGQIAVVESEDEALPIGAPADSGDGNGSGASDGGTPEAATDP